MLIDEPGVDLAASECGVIEDADQKGDVRADAKDRKAAQRGDGPFDRSFSRFRRHDQLREQRIVHDWNFGAFDHARVDADPWPRRLAVEQQGPGLRQKTSRRIFGIDAGFDGMAALSEAFLRPRQRFASRHRQLRPHEVDAGNRFSDRVLDLKARVHLEEIEPRIVARPFE